MSKRKERTPTQKSAVLRVVRTPLFRKRVERNKKKYYRKEKFTNRHTINGGSF